jgi:hypothetical protein
MPNNPNTKTAVDNTAGTDIHIFILIRVVLFVLAKQVSYTSEKMQFQMIKNAPPGNRVPSR